MLHIFADPADMQGELLTIHGEEVRHMKNVLRLRPGDEVSVSNGVDSREYRYGIESYGEDADGQANALLRLRFVKEADVELPVQVTLFQGLPKQDKMDWIVQKCVELGVHEIVPVAMQRCVMKLTGERAGRRVERWQKIAEAAAMQSRRRIVPKIQEPLTMQEAVAYARQQCDLLLLPYELQKEDGSTRALFEEIRKGCIRRIGFFIGPEGGFAPSEAAAAEAAGAKPISLGRRILRTETAGMVVLSWLIYATEL